MSNKLIRVQYYIRCMFFKMRDSNVVSTSIYKWEGIKSGYNTKFQLISYFVPMIIFLIKKTFGATTFSIFFPFYLKYLCI